MAMRTPLSGNEFNRPGKRAEEYTKCVHNRQNPFAPTDPGSHADQSLVQGRVMKDPPEEIITEVLKSVFSPAF